MTRNDLNEAILNVFGDLYPACADHTDGIIVNWIDDETIEVELEGVPHYHCELDSDDDGNLYFYPKHSLIETDPIVVPYPEV